MSGKKSASYGSQNQSTLVAGKKRVRSTSVCVWLSPDEQAKIRERMADVGIRNLSAYMRKMALNGYVLHVDLVPVKEIVSLQRRCANNLNQIAVRANTYGGVYPGGFGGTPTSIFALRKSQVYNTCTACRLVLPLETPQMIESGVILLRSVSCSNRS